MQKITAALRVLAHGAPGDSVDEYARVGESGITESFKRFNRAIIELNKEKCRSKTYREKRKKSLIRSSWISRFD